MALNRSHARTVVERAGDGQDAAGWYMGRGSSVPNRIAEVYILCDRSKEVVMQERCERR